MAILQTKPRAKRSRSISRAVEILAVVAAGAVGLPAAAHAYLDPASGSMIIQALITAVMGGLFIFRKQWRRLLSFFSSKPSDAKVADTPDEPEHQS